MKITTNQERLIELFDSDLRSDSAIASELNVSKQAISAWRKGIRSPKKSVLINIARMYNVSIEWLMGFDVPKNPLSMNLQLFSSGTPISSSEAMIISGGVDSMSKEKRQQALKLLQIAFPDNPDFFKEEE